MGKFRIPRLNFLRFSTIAQSYKIQPIRDPKPWIGSPKEQLAKGWVSGSKEIWLLDRNQLNRYPCYYGRENSKLSSLGSAPFPAFRLWIWKLFWNKYFFENFEIQQFVTLDSLSSLWRHQASRPSVRLETPRISFENSLHFQPLGGAIWRKLYGLRKSCTYG